MASGSSGRNSAGSKGFDFAADDILCSYEDYANQDATRSDPAIASNSAKEFHKSRMARSPMFTAPAYSPPEESFNQDLVSSVEKAMKNHTDNLMRFLEGISSHLSQLELYCYNLDKSIGEMRADLVRDHEESDSKLKSLEKHLQEVHKSVQILRDKQALAETQKELAKLQLAQKESSSTSHSQQNEDRAPQPASDPKKNDNLRDMRGQQLALALPHQVAPQPSKPARPLEQQQQQPMTPSPPQSVPQSQAYYLPPTQISNPPAPGQPSQGQYLPSDSQYQTPQMQEPSMVPAAATPSPVNQPRPFPPLPQYQQQWPQQLPQQVTPPQTSMQPQIRGPTTTVYTPYLPSQPTNSSPPEPLPISMPMQMPYSGISQPGGSRAEAMPYGYGGLGRTVQQPLQAQQQLESNFGGQLNDGYPPPSPHPSLSPGNAYMMYQGPGEGGRAHHPPQPPHFPKAGYPPTSVPIQGPQPPSAAANLMVRPPPFMRNHPYGELIDKLVTMGYRGDHVGSVIQRLEESGQPVDFNAVLDVLNGHPSGGPPRGWSG